MKVDRHCGDEIGKKTFKIKLTTTARKNEREKIQFEKVPHKIPIHWDLPSLRFLCSRSLTANVIKFTHFPTLPNLPKI